jgi:RNA-directed DNA polymerase
VAPALLESVAASHQLLYSRIQAKISGKSRTLRIPYKKLMEIQSKLCNVLDRIPPHPNAYCVPRRSALRAALLHRGHSYFFHTDIKNFFPSTTAQRVQDTFARLGADSRISRILTLLVTCDDQVPQGAPTSVTVANLVLFPLDNRIAGICLKHGLSYSRYVDDLAISGGERLDWISSKIRSYVEQEGWQVNPKGGLMTEEDSHPYLGLVINASANVTRQYVEDLRSVARHARKLSIPLGATYKRRIEGRLQYVGTINPAKEQTLRKAFSGLL